MAYKDRNCFILKSINYKDADKIFTLYTDKDGKISALAKGVRKVSSKRAGSLDRLNLVRLSYYQSSSGYKTITEVSNITSFRNIKDDPLLMNLSYKIVGLLIKNIEEDHRDERLFSLIERTFSLLDERVLTANAVYAHFLLNFMEILGYKLSLNNCVSCKRSLSKDWSSSGFNYDLGGLVCSDCVGFEQVMDLKTAALMSKAKNLNEKDHQFYKKDSIYLDRLLDILDQYVEFKLNI